MSRALTFNDVILTPIIHQNRFWIRSAELARALGYSDTRKIAQLYERNADEFTSEMTQVIELSGVPKMSTPENLKYKARIFSLRGCHLLAMFARTPVAKEFRRWVLDVLDTLTKDSLEAQARRYALASECAWRQGYDEGRASALPDLLAAERAARKEAASAMLALKPRQRVLLKKALRYTAMGLSSREISKLLDCAHREAGQLLSTARKNGLLPLAVKSAVTENHAHLRMVQGRLS